MGFFTFARNFVEKAVGAAAGFAVGGPAGAAAGAAIVGAAQGQTKPLQIAANAAGGYFGASGVASGLSAASAASTAAGGVGPVATSFGSQATVFGNAVLSGIENSPLGTAVSAASNLIGSPGVSKAVSGLSAVASAATAYSSFEASKQGGTPKMPDATAPGNDPAAIALADQAAADEITRKRRGASANILTSPLGIGGAGQSASQTLLG